MKNKKYVLTGGPGVGKTTIMEELDKKGYSTFPEVAKVLIEEQQKKNGKCLPWINLQKFQNEVARRQISLEKSNKSKILFLDRGIIDGYGYSKNGGVKPSKLISKYGRKRYESVFILDVLPKYKNSSYRKEDLVSAKKIHRAIYMAYIKFGYKPIRVPVLPLKQRTNFILNFIKNKK